jgi:hypothetical protein
MGFRYLKQHIFEIYSLTDKRFIDLDFIIKALPEHMQMNRQLVTKYHKHKNCAGDKYVQEIFINYIAYSSDFFAGHYRCR